MSIVFQLMKNEEQILIYHVGWGGRPGRSYLGVFRKTNSAGMPYNCRLMTTDKSAYCLAFYVHVNNNRRQDVLLFESFSLHVPCVLSLMLITGMRIRKQSLQILKRSLGNLHKINTSSSA